jgi:hypothetical protein
MIGLPVPNLRLKWNAERKAGLYCAKRQKSAPQRTVINISMGGLTSPKKPITELRFSTTASSWVSDASEQRVRLELPSGARQVETVQLSDTQLLSEVDQYNGGYVDGSPKYNSLMCLQTGSFAAPAGAGSPTDLDDSRIRNARKIELTLRKSLLHVPSGNITRITPIESTFERAGDVFISARLLFRLERSCI